MRKSIATKIITARSVDKLKISNEHKAQIEKAGKVKLTPESIAEIEVAIWRYRLIKGNYQEFRTDKKAHSKFKKINKLLTKTEDAIIKEISSGDCMFYELIDLNTRYEHTADSLLDALNELKTITGKLLNMAEAKAGRPRDKELNILLEELSGCYERLEQTKRGNKAEFVMEILKIEGTGYQSLSALSRQLSELKS